MQILSAYLLATVSGGGYAGNMLPENLLNLSNWEKNGAITIDYADGVNNVTVATDGRGEYIQLIATGLEAGKMYEFSWDGCCQTMPFPGYIPGYDYVDVFITQQYASMAQTKWDLTSDTVKNYTLDFISNTDTATIRFDFGKVKDSTITKWVIENLALYEVN